MKVETRQGDTYGRTWYAHTRVHGTRVLGPVKPMVQRSLLIKKFEFYSYPGIRVDQRTWDLGTHVPGTQVFGSRSPGYK